MKVVQNTRPLGARVKASEIDGLVRALTIQEQAHGSDRPRQNDRSSGIDTPRFEVGPRALQREKGGRGLRRTKGVEFLFPRGVGNLVVLYGARRAGHGGRNGNTLGTLVCESFQCSKNVRMLPPSAYLGFDREAARQERIVMLRERSASFALSVAEEA